MAQINHFCAVNRSEILADYSDILTGERVAGIA